MSAATPEEYIDDAWRDQQEKNGYAVISRDEWRQRLDGAASDGYAEGRKDEREEWSPVLEALRDVLRIAAAASIGITGNQPRLDRARAAIAKATKEKA